MLTGRLSEGGQYYSCTEYAFRVVLIFVHVLESSCVNGQIIPNKNERTG